MILCGIDYSLTSPCVCVHNGEDWKYENCRFYFFKAKPDWGKQYRGKEYPSWNSDQHRYQLLTAWVMDIVQSEKVDKAYIEGYAFGASGRVFHIAENTGLMKYGLYIANIPFETVAPTSVKKFATDKGNADKNKMIESFHQDTNVNIFNELGVKEGRLTPASDIVDAYFITKFGFDNEKNNNIERAA